jgi:hypothetical protein
MGRVKDEGGSEGRPVIDQIGVATSPRAKAGRLPSGVGGSEPSANRRRGQSRSVGGIAKVHAGAAPATDDIISVAGTAAVTSRSPPSPMGRPRLVRAVVGRRSRARSYLAEALFNT